jgi:hypothetical protein
MWRLAGGNRPSTSKREDCSLSTHNYTQTIGKDRVVCGEVAQILHESPTYETGSVSVKPGDNNQIHLLMIWQPLTMIDARKGPRTIPFIL